MTLTSFDALYYFLSGSSILMCICCTGRRNIWNGFRLPEIEFPMYAQNLQNRYPPEQPDREVNVEERREYVLERIIVKKVEPTTNKTKVLDDSSDHNTVATHTIMYHADMDSTPPGSPLSQISQCQYDDCSPPVSPVSSADGEYEDAFDFNSQLLLDKESMSRVSLQRRSTTRDIEGETNNITQNQNQSIQPHYSSLKRRDIHREEEEDHEEVQESESQVCAICLDDYEIGENICKSKNHECPHEFHERCIMEWLMHHDDCPMCRLDFLNEAEVDIEAGI
mmetsp:Transcript_9886/g.12521  ORF Transcript_9886/g.12521 Transcript_9886/m.12521 type:complete len:280 (-) Transcript_9886:212-1051(-)